MESRRGSTNFKPANSQSTCQSKRMLACTDSANWSLVSREKCNGARMWGVGSSVWSKETPQNSHTNKNMMHNCSMSLPSASQGDRYLDNPSTLR